MDQIISPAPPPQAPSQSQDEPGEERSLNYSLINANPPTDFIPVVFAPAQSHADEAEIPSTDLPSGSPVAESPLLAKQMETDGGFPMVVTNGVVENMARATSPALSSSGRLEYTSICFGDEEELETTNTTTPQCSSD